LCCLVEVAVHVFEAVLLVVIVESVAGFAAFAVAVAIIFVPIEPYSF